MQHRDQREQLSLDHLVPKILRQLFRTSFVHPEIYCSTPTLAGASYRGRRSKEWALLNAVATEIVDVSGMW